MGRGRAQRSETARPDPAQCGEEASRATKGQALAGGIDQRVKALDSVAYRLGTEPDAPELIRLRHAYLEAWTDELPRTALGEALELALDLGRIGKAAAWARALAGVDPAAMGEFGDAPAMWLVDLVERLDRKASAP